MSKDRIYFVKRSTPGVYVYNKRYDGVVPIEALRMAFDKAVEIAKEKRMAERVKAILKKVPDTRGMDIEKL